MSLFMIVIHAPSKKDPKVSSLNDCVSIVTGIYSDEARAFKYEGFSQSNN